MEFPQVENQKDKVHLREIRDIPAPYILYVWPNCETEKIFQWLMRAMSLMKSDNFYLVLVGEGEEYQSLQDFGFPT